jgi:DNA invertase Pin-like site-specific DNA recombinase
MISEDKPTEYFAIYTRQSTESQLALNSCTVQFEQCMEYANKKLRHCKWIGQRLNDEGVSGATLDRPSLAQLRALINKNQVQHVLVTHIDRLSRRLTDSMILLEEFQNAGVHIYMVKTPELNKNANGTFLTNILASFAQFEREMTHERIAETRAYLKKHGRRIAGRIPLGYDADPVTKQLVINKDEALQVKNIFGMALDTAPTQIAADINRGGWRTKSYKSKRTGMTTGGTAWSARKITALLRNPVYTGKFADGESTRSGCHEAIISSLLFGMVKKRLDARRTTDEKSRYKMNFVLRDKIVCPNCGRKLCTYTGRRKISDKGGVIYLYYKCRSTANGKAPCPSVQYSAYGIETMVSQILGDSVTWQGLRRYNTSLPDEIADVSTAWNMLDAPAQNRLMTLLVEEVRITKDKMLTVKLCEDFLKILEQHRFLPEQQVRI